MSFKEFYNKYVNWIVIVLICLVMIKGCQSCTRKRQVRFNEIKTEQMSNSLNIAIDSLNVQIDSLNKVISLIKSFETSLQKVIRPKCDSNLRLF